MVGLLVNGNIFKIPFESERGVGLEERRVLKTFLSQDKTLYIIPFQAPSLFSLNSHDMCCVIYHTRESEVG